MKERPIIFSSPMVRAILENRKTQTRRVIKRQPPDQHYFCRKLLKTSGDQSRVGKYFYLDTHNRRTDDVYFNCPFGEAGDHLWVRETWHPDSSKIDGSPAYKADVDYDTRDCKWKSPIFMPRSASRTLLEITNIRVERLQKISEEDAIAEGVRTIDVAAKEGATWCDSPRRAYRFLWNSINGKGSWDMNPWVFVISFRRI